MPFLAANLGLKVPFGLQFRVLSVPWVSRNRAICCSKGRDYCSSGPVRYKPNEPSETNKSESPPPSKDLRKNKSVDSLNLRALGIMVRSNGNGMPRSIVSNEKLEIKSGVHKKNALHIDAKQAFSEEEIAFSMEVIDNELMEQPDKVAEEIIINQGKGIPEQNVLGAGRIMQDAEKWAIEILATRAYTTAELRKKLQRKRIPSDVIEALLNSFQRRGLINDSLFAETFSRSRWSSLSWGPRRIKQALFKKGVSEEDAEKAVKLVFEDGVEESNLGLSKVSVDHLFVQASKQWLRGQDASKETRKGRIIRWLQYRGFNWGVISIILKKLESQHPP